VEEVDTTADAGFDGDLFIDGLQYGMNTFLIKITDPSLQVQNYTLKIWRGSGPALQVTLNASGSDYSSDVTGLTGNPSAISFWSQTAWSASEIDSGTAKLEIANPGNRFAILLNGVPAAYDEATVTSSVYFKLPNDVPAPDENDPLLLHDGDNVFELKLFDAQGQYLKTTFHLYVGPLADGLRPAGCDGCEGSLPITDEEGQPLGAVVDAVPYWYGTLLPGQTDFLIDLKLADDATAVVYDSQGGLVSGDGRVFEFHLTPEQTEPGASHTFTVIVTRNGQSYLSCIEIGYGSSQ
jgi:hypothetical protein